MLVTLIVNRITPTHFHIYFHLWGNTLILWMQEPPPQTHQQPPYGNNKEINYIQSVQGHCVQTWFDWDHTLNLKEYNLGESIVVLVVMNGGRSFNLYGSRTGFSTINIFVRYCSGYFYCNRTLMSYVGVGRGGG